MNHPQSRHGFTVLEVLAAMVLLAGLTTVCLQFFHGLADGQRENYQRLTAIQEAENLLERLTALPWDEMTPQAGAEMKLSAQGSQALPDGQVEAHVDDPTGDPPAKRISVVVRWQNREGNTCPPVRLVTWKYKI
jgi:prepilin-type N-terminal cleavage/methylation domain-containing protein